MFSSLGAAIVFICDAGCCVSPAARSSSQVRDSPHTLSSKHARVALTDEWAQPAPVDAAWSRQQAIADAVMQAVASQQLQQQAPAASSAHASPQLDASPHGATDCSSGGSSALDGSFSASALAFAAETPVVSHRQSVLTGGGGGASTPFFTPSVASAVSARQLPQPSAMRSLSSGSDTQPEQPEQQQQRRQVAPRMPEPAQPPPPPQAPPSPQQAPPSPRQLPPTPSRVERPPGPPAATMAPPPAQPTRNPPGNQAEAAPKGAPLSPSAVFNPRGQLPRTVRFVLIFH